MKNVQKKTFNIIEVNNFLKIFMKDSNLRFYRT